MPADFKDQKALNLLENTGICYKEIICLFACKS